jgi:hypothetical protein
LAGQAAPRTANALARRQLLWIFAAIDDGRWVVPALGRLRCASRVAVALAARLPGARRVDARFYAVGAVRALFMVAALWAART